MDNPQRSQNPYQPPTSEKLGSTEPKRERKFKGIVWLFVVSFVLAHVVFWPALVILSQSPATRGDYGISAALNALGIATAIGFIYGICVGRFLANKDWGIAMLYGLGELLWFPVSIVTPCTVILVGL